MNINATVKNIFLKIAKKLGLELQKKSENQIDFSAAGLNPTAIGAAVVANIAVDDSDIIIDGQSNRAEAIRKIANYFSDEIFFGAAEVSLGTGDCIVRPYTDGKYIGLNIIGNSDFAVVESIGPHLKGIIIKLDERKIDKATYRLFETQTLKKLKNKSVVYVRRFAYKDDNEIDLASTHWALLHSEDVIQADQLLIGRYKCPTLNRLDYNSANGVPITFGCESIIENVKNKYLQYNEEFDRKQSIIFADKTMFKREKNTNKNNESDNSDEVKFRLEGKHFIRVGGNIDGGINGMIQDYSPDVREPEFKNALDLNLSILELCCGFSRGIFTSPETSFATATEMKNSLKKTFAFVKRFRKQIEYGDEMLFNAINIIMNLNNITPVGDFSLRHDWSYDYIEQSTERFNQLLQGHSAGVVKDETLSAWINNLKEDEAKQYIKELKEAADPTDDYEENTKRTMG